MAVTLYTDPPHRSFSQNDIALQLQTDQIDIFSFAAIVFVITGSGPAAGQSVTFGWNNIEVTLTSSANPDDSGTQIPLKQSASIDDYLNDLIEAFLQNETIFKYFTVNKVFPGVTIKFKTREAITFTSTDDFNGSIDVQLNNSTGPYLQSNLEAQIEVVQIESNGVENPLSLHSPFYVPTKLADFNLKNAFSLSPHLPASASIGAVLGSTYQWGEAENAFTSYYFRYAEKYGTPAKTRALLRSVDKVAIYGGLSSDTRNTFFAVPGSKDIVCHNYDRSGNHPKELGPDQPDWIYLFTQNDRTGVAPNVVVTYEDNTTEIFSIPNLSFDLVKDRLYWFSVGLKQMNISLPTDKQVVRYTWRLSNVEQTLHYASINFEIDCAPHPWNLYLLMSNGLGGCESVRLKGKTNKDFAVKREKFQKVRTASWTIEDGDYGNFNTRGGHVYRANTGWYEDTNYLEHLQQLLLGDIWLIDTINSRFMKVTADSNSFRDVKKDDEDLFALNFNFRSASIDQNVNHF